MDFLSDFLSRADRILLPTGNSELTDEAKAIRRKYGMPINPITRAEPFELVIPFDPANDKAAVTKLVNAYDAESAIWFTLKPRKMEWEFELSAKVADVQVRDQRRWKFPRLVVSLAPLDMPPLETHLRVSQPSE